MLNEHFLSFGWKQWVDCRQQNVGSRTSAAERRQQLEVTDAPAGAVTRTNYLSSSSVINPITVQIEYRESKAQTDLASLKELLYNKGTKLFKQVTWARNTWTWLLLEMQIVKTLTFNNQRPCLPNKASYYLLFLLQFDQLKKDWEMVHMVLAILKLLVPCVTARLQEVSLTKLLSYLGSLDIDKDADNLLLSRYW